MWKWMLLAVSLPALLSAQMMPLGGVCRQKFKPVQDLNLSEAQQKQIAGICKDSSKKVSDLRDSWNKAEEELRAAFDESPVDQAKSNIAIEHLTVARSDLFRATSQMEVKIRLVLTDEQWKELKKRDKRGGGPNGGPWRRGGPPPPKGPPPTTQNR
jgi:Spy/CpxP family protein refolding chaperone